MPIHKSSPVSEVHMVFIERWSIREVENGNRHFVGFNIAEQDGRVSTPIVSFDWQSRIGTTSSGRQYRLLGKAGYDKDAEYVCSRVVGAWMTGSWRDVTPEI
jgi:hypothetical protein